MDTRDVDRHATPERTRALGSSASLQSRGTAGSSNASSANLSHRRVQNIRSDRGKMHDTEQSRRDGQGGDLLQEKLREMKAARMHESRKSRDASSYEDSQRETQSSPAGPRRGGREQELNAASPGDRRADRASGKQKLGVKATEDRVSALLNENFDLKLKLHHRKEQQSKLEERLEALEAQAKQQLELQEMNEQLVAELAKRDQAVEQAVNIIIELEEKIDKLMEERNAVRSLQAATSIYLSDRDDGTNNQNLGSSPPDDPQHRANNDTTPVGHRRKHSYSRAIARMPSFLSEQTEETEALRSLYLPRDQTQSLPRLSEDNGVKGEDIMSELDGMNSPRLSVLSESSFVSVYGAKAKDQDLDSLDLEYENMDSPEPGRLRKASSVDQWVGEALKNVNPTERKTSGPRRTSGVPQGQFLSMNDVVKSPLQRLEKLQRTLERRNKPVIAARFLQSTSDHKLSDPPRSAPPKKDNIRRTDLDSFEHQHTLPPTPDTFSTNTLQHYKTSSDNLNDDASRPLSSQIMDLEDGRPYLNRAHTGPEYMLARLRRPRSAAETITSRREGHGWDTATQSEITETNSDIASDATSTLDPWISAARENLRPAAFRPPEMFSFGDDYNKDWGRDVMFNRRDGDIPIRSRKPFNANTSTHDDDITPTLYRFERTKNGYEREELNAAQVANQIETSYRPSPPERRSSLAMSPPGNEKRLRRLQQARAEAESPTFPPDPPPHAPKASPQKSTEGEQPKRGLLKMFGIGRSASAAVTQAPPPAYTRMQSNEQANNANKAVAKRNPVVQDIRSASATPPPISRYPRARTNAPLERSPDAPRPSTSHSMESRAPNRVVKRERRLSTGHVPGSATTGTYTDGSDATGILEEGAGGRDIRDTASTRTRRWYALGRTGSLRR